MNYLFANPGALLGLVAIAVPVAIHLLLRRKPVVEYWGATRFLKKIIERKRAQLQVHSYTQLLVRMAILALIVLAVADPRIDVFGDAVEKQHETHRLLIIDVTMSMEATQDGESRFDEAKRQFDSLIGQSLPGDSWQLLLHGSTDEPVRVRVPVYEPQFMKELCSKLKPTAEAGAIVDTLRRAKNLVEEFPGSRNEILFWTDLAAHDWQQEGSTAYEINTYLEQLSQVAQISVIDVARRSLQNVAVVDLKILENYITLGERVRLQATFKNYSTNASRFPATLFIGGEQIVEKNVSLEPLEKRSVVFEILVTRSGINECRVEIEEDALIADNTRHFAFHVNDTIDVLIVEEKSNTDSLRQSDFLDLAFSTIRETHSPAIVSMTPRYRVTKMTPVMFRRSTVSQFDVMIVCGLSQLSEFDAQRLQDFVAAGGGLMLSMSGKMSLTDYNNMLGPEGNRLLPVTLQAKVSIPNLESAPFQIGRINTELPLLHPFEQHPTSGLKTTRIYSYVETNHDSEQASTNVIELENGSPLIVASEQLTGKVFLVTTSFNTEWGSWVLWPSFLPMIQRMVDELADKNASVTSSVIGTNQFEVLTNSQRALSVEKPDGQKIQSNEFGSFDTFDDIETLFDEPGLYTVKDDKREQPVRWVVRNVNIAESDLRHLPHNKFSASRALKGLNISVAEEASAIGGARSGVRFVEDSRFARWLLSLATFLFVVDQLFSILPAAAYGTLFGGVLAGCLAYIAELSPAKNVVLVAMCVGLCLYLSLRFTDRGPMQTGSWNRTRRA